MSAVPMCWASADRRAVGADQRAGALVGNRMDCADTQRKGRIMNRRKRRDVIVEDIQQHIGSLVFQPTALLAHTLQRRLAMPDRLACPCRAQSRSSGVCELAIAPRFLPCLKVVGLTIDSQAT